MSTSTSPNLPAGAFTTTLNGKRCTAVPKVQAASSVASVATSTAIQNTATSVVAAPTSNLIAPIIQTSTALETITSTTSSTSTSTLLQTSSTTAQEAPLVQTSAAAVVPSVLISTTTASSVSAVSSAQQLTTSTSAFTASGLDTTAVIVPAKSTVNNPAIVSSATRSTGSTASTTGATSIADSEASLGNVNNASNMNKTVAIIGGVIGGLVLLTLVALALWFCRKRLQKKRRSTLLTPLGPEPGFGLDEKGPYKISRGSIGPTPVSEKFKNAVGNSFRNIRGRLNEAVSPNPAGSVNMDRGNSQFITSGAAAAGAGIGMITTKDRFKNWLSRANEDAHFNWRLREGNMRRSGSNDPFLARGMPANTKSATGSSPDFLTLLSMDDQQLAAQTKKKRNSKRRSTSAGSRDHFLGGLGLDFESSTNPFSDANVMVHDDNPFNDTNAIKGPNTYVDNIRRSRGQSINNIYLGVQDRADSIYRESGLSVDSFSGRRNKFRSDPFDLDRPELLSSSVGSSVGSSVVSSAALPSPQRVHARQDSFSSKYSSGVSSMGSLYQWSDPGPDVGPASRWESPTPTGDKKYTPVVRKSGSSHGSVGKAL